MNILITGGCGYVGSELVNKLLSKGHLITVIDVQWFGNPLKKHKNLTRWYQQISKRKAVIKGYDFMDRGENIPNV